MFFLLSFGDFFTIFRSFIPFLPSRWRSRIVWVIFVVVFSVIAIIALHPHGRQCWQFGFCVSASQIAFVCNRNGFPDWASNVGLWERVCLRLMAPPPTPHWTWDVTATVLDRRLMMVSDACVTLLHRILRFGVHSLAEIIADGSDVSRARTSATQKPTSDTCWVQKQKYSTERSFRFAPAHTLHTLNNDD